jgi:hypothetical protein
MKTMSRLKGSRMTQGTELLEELSDVTFSGMIVEFARMGALQRAYNIVVTNVPGPPVPLFLLGARLEEIYPVVPLFSNQALGIALFSYCGQLCWGFNADWDTLHDLHDFVEMIQVELDRLLETVPARRPKRNSASRPNQRRPGGTKPRNRTKPIESTV